MNEDNLRWPDVFLVMEWNGRTYEDSETRVVGVHFLLIQATQHIKYAKRIEYDGTDKIVPINEQFYISKWRQNKEIAIYEYVKGAWECPTK